VPAVERLDAPAGEEDPQPDSAWWGWHVARYAFAAGLVGGRAGGGTVLDIACGTGYGARLLGQRGGRRVVGADVDLPALAAARAAGPVAAADGARLPFRSGAFDAVVTMETIEHLKARAAFVGELARVLAPGGLLVLSTPNALHSRPVDGVPANPFHVHEYLPDELVEELAAGFDVDQLLGQDISDRFRISPFWDDQERLPRTAPAQARRLAWRVLNKLPAGARDAGSNALWGHPLFPGPGDYTFKPEAATTARTLVAVARRRVTG
jgi:SAM-dependent methyltransferase